MNVFFVDSQPKTLPSKRRNDVLEATAEGKVPN
jgi:hypothetical protein